MLIEISKIRGMKMETVPVAIGALGVITKKHREAHKQDYRKGTFTPSLCQCSVLRVFKATATQIREKSEQTLVTENRTGDL